MRSTRLAVLTVAAALVAVATPAAAQKHAKQALDSAALVKRFPEALVYEGIGRARQNDYTGAIEVWERFVSTAENPADTAAVNPLIREAYLRAYPLARVYQGIAFYVAKDFGKAIASWESYLEYGAAERDRAEVGKLIAQAREQIRKESVAKAH